MKKPLIITLLILLIASCKEDTSNTDIAPSFKLVEFKKEKVDSLYYCSAVISIKGLTDKFSIDGLLKANKISSIYISLPYHTNPLYDIHEEYEGTYYFNMYGRHHGDLILKLEFTSKEGLNNYLVGWHLTYGFGQGCQVLMVNLTKR